MEVLKYPLNKYLGLEESEKANCIYKMRMSDGILNHLGTHHAVALFGLAEASSAKYLMDTFSVVSDKVIPVVRKTEIKYSSPSTGTVHARVKLYESDRLTILESIYTKKRVIIRVNIELLNDSSDRIMIAVIDWFVTLDS